MYILQSLLIAVVSALLSLPASAAICRAIGSSSAFLEFQSTAHLRVEYTQAALYYALIAAAAGILTMALPAIGYARLTIVDSKRAAHARNQSSLWQKFGLDFILLGISLYGLYAFNNQKALLAEQAQSGAALDPLIYIASSLFTVGAALFMVRIIPLLAQAVFALFKNRMRPGLYASFLQILRSRKKPDIHDDVSHAHHRHRHPQRRHSLHRQHRPGNAAQVRPGRGRGHPGGVAAPVGGVRRDRRPRATARSRA